MKVVILAGGFGTRISEESHLRPKPMIEIGGKPILWHIMKYYSTFGFNDFVICCGYKGYLIKEYFINYLIHNSDVTVDIGKNKYDIHETRAENWRVSLVDTGEDANTGGRLKRIKHLVAEEKSFCMTYGDGLSDVDIGALIQFHNENKKLVTVTAVKPPGRFGSLVGEGNLVEGFSEKPKGDGAYINGGFFVLESAALELIGSPSDSWESDILPVIANERQLTQFKHRGFWQSMDTLRDKNYLESLWGQSSPPWRRW